MTLRDLMATQSNPEATRGSVLLVLRYQGLFKHNLVDEHLQQQTWPTWPLKSGCDNGAHMV